MRFTQEAIDAIFFTTITKEDGSKSRLELNVPAQEIDDRAASIFAETGIVEEVGDGVEGIKKGDIAIISYELFNDYRKMLSEDDNGRLFIVDPVTTYHQEDNIAYGDQNNPRNQLVWNQGEIDNVSQLLGIIQGEELIANHPYIFLNYLPEEQEFKAGGLMYTDSPEVIERQILSISKTSTKKYDVKNGDMISIRTLDTFPVKFLGKELICCNDEDLLTVKETV